MYTINLVGKRLLVIRNRKKHSDNEVSNNYFESPTQTDHNSRRPRCSQIIFILFSCFSCGRFEKTLVTWNLWKLSLSFIFSFPAKEQTRKNNKKEKLYIFFLNMIWNIEMNFNTIFIYNTYTYICITMISNIMQNCLYNIKVKKFPLAFRKRNIWNISMTFGTFGHQAEPLARRMTRWHIYWHFGT